LKKTRAVSKGSLSVEGGVQRNREITARGTDPRPLRPRRARDISRKVIRRPCENGGFATIRRERSGDLSKIERGKGEKNSAGRGEGGVISPNNQQLKKNDNAKSSTRTLRWEE